MVNTRRQLTKNFRIEEFDCRDGTKVPRSHEEALVLLCRTYLEPMRARFGSCTVSSGFRSARYNEQIGGARYSFHIYHLRKPADGVAADIRFAKGTPFQWRRRARRIRRFRRKLKGGIGYYPQGGFIHVDTRNYKADWNGS